MKLCMTGRAALSAAVPQPHADAGAGEGRLSAWRFTGGEAMGRRLDWSRFHLTAEPIGRHQRRAAQMSFTTSDLVADGKVRDLELEMRDPRTVVAVILGGGAGTRLFPLTMQRAKPAVLD